MAIRILDMASIIEASAGKRKGAMDPVGGSTLPLTHPTGEAGS